MRSSQGKYRTVYWATLLQTARAGYDPGTQCFSKDNLPHLKFHDRCYFVSQKELKLGIEKAKKIAQKAARDLKNIPAICVLEARLPSRELIVNQDGFGFYRVGSAFPVSRLFLFVHEQLKPILSEELKTFQEKEEIHEHS